MLLEMERNQQIVFLTADLGFNALEPIKEKFPDRFINVGIAEQFMVGMAAGLALEGKKVVIYSIAPFVVMRPYEQIRTDICYHNLDVKIIGTGGGYNYANHGVTHHSVEDVAIMNALPNMKVLSPAYSWEATEATKAIMKDRGPVYMRLGKSPGTDFSQPHHKFMLGRGFVVKEGKDIVLVSTGNVLDVAVETARLLEEVFHKPVCVISMPSIKPLDEALLLDRARGSRALFTIEEHSIIGGLGAHVSALLWKNRIAQKKFHAFGFPDSFLKAVGDRDHLLGLVGIEPNNLAKKITEIMRHP